MSSEHERSVRRVSRREAMQGAGVALGSLVASGSLTETVMAQSGGPTNEISGVVEDSSGPVQGATVVAVPHDTSLAALETTTASDGTYMFDQADLYEGENLYHVIARGGSETDPRRGEQNYPFIAAEGPAAIPDSGGVHQWNFEEGSGTTVTDAIGSLDLNFNGLSWSSGDGAGGAHGVTDGTDDQAELNTTDLTSLRNSGTGTLFIWHRLDGDPSTNDFQLLTTNESSSGTNILTRLDGAAYDFSLAIEGNFTSLNGGTVNQGEWTVYAPTADGTTMRLYVAQPPDYDVIELDSGSVPATTTNEWSVAPVFAGRNGSGQNFDGGLDYSFYDNTAWTQSELQTIVDDTKGFFS